MIGLIFFCYLFCQRNLRNWVLCIVSVYFLLFLLHTFLRIYNCFDWLINCSSLREKIIMNQCIWLFLKYTLLSRLSLSISFIVNSSTIFNTLFITIIRQLCPNKLAEMSHFWWLLKNMLNNWSYNRDRWSYFHLFYIKL